MNRTLFALIVLTCGGLMTSAQKCHAQVLIARSASAGWSVQQPLVAGGTLRYTVTKTDEPDQTFVKSLPGEANVTVSKDSGSYSGTITSFVSNDGDTTYSSSTPAQMLLRAYGYSDIWWCNVVSSISVGNQSVTGGTSRSGTYNISDYATLDIGTLAPTASKTASGGVSGTASQE